MREKNKLVSLGVFLTLTAMTGLYLHVDYSGWVLFVGLVMIWANA